jgi:adenylate cyclase
MREQGTLSIMFADIAGSTRLYERLGDARARQITSQCIALMTRVTQGHQGTVIKTIGDEVMSTYPSADAAAEAAVEMQEAVQSEAPSWGTPLTIRIGFHYGPVILEGGDVFGDAVNLAARMAAQAKGDQIITTGETLEAMTSPLRNNTRLLITTTVKGKVKPVEIHELTWGEEEDLTIMGGMSPSVAVAAPPRLSMKVTCQGQTLEVNQDRAAITMGRDAKNTFMIADIMASRMHARIEFRRDRFVLVDKSTNGTYVFTSKGRKFIHQDELVLEG